MKSLFYLISLASIIGLSASLLQGFIAPSIFFTLSTWFGVWGFTKRGSEATNITLYISLIFYSTISIGQTSTPSSHTISKTISVGEILLLDLQGDIEIKSTKGSRVIIETKIQTSLPLHIQNAISQSGVWGIVDFQNKTTRETIIQVKGFDKPLFYKKQDVEMKYSSTIYVPENVIVKRV